MFETRNICLSMGRNVILDQVSIAARPGAVTAIVGPNGSGKTSLLRAMTGDLESTGDILLDGDDMRRMKAWDLASRRAVLPQASTLAFPFTVIEVVRIGLRRGLAGSSDAIVFAALGKVGLLEHADRMYQELSGGEQQRVQLARVLCQVWDPVSAGVPRWLFLDEPVSSLDIGHQLEVMGIMRDFANHGGGVITVMHDLNLTALYADKVIMMCAGKVLAQGSPDAVLCNTTLSKAYGCAIRINTPPATGTPFILPHAAGSGINLQDVS
jgi:iron complex transport system ATP-binding protein